MDALFGPFRSLPRRRSAAPRPPTPRSRSLLPLSLLVMLTLLAGMGDLAARAATTARNADLGDAPDSSNHFNNAPMEAYPGVPARFPTVWDGTPAAEPAGPIHFNPGLAFLGSGATIENDADQPPDADGRTNLEFPAGAAPVANQDGLDDGWLRQNDTFISDCRETRLRVKVGKSPNLQAEQLYLNVWYDGTRDGDWADVRVCPDGDRVAFEWIVQNFPIAASTISATNTISGTFAEFDVPTFLVLDAPAASDPSAGPWMRFTLSDQPAPRGPAGEPNDGRGPSPPAGYALGETEDYRYTPRPQSTPGTITIEKSGPPAATVGSTFEYSLFLGHQGTPNNSPAFASLVDVLPPELSLVEGPLFIEEGNTGAPGARFAAAEGPSGAIRWEGGLAPGTGIGIRFKVRLNFCPPANATGGRLVRNEVRVLQEGKTPISDVVETAVECQAPPQPPISLEKRILLDALPENTPSVPQVEASPLPGQGFTYLLTLSSTGDLSHTIHISDTLPPGLLAVETGASAGVAAIIDGGRTAVWDGIVEPANRPVRIKIRVRPIGQLGCDARLINQAFWFTRFHRGASNPTTLALACQDLGDAPDSTNHQGAAMLAYPGVPAAFPTVFDGPDPRGPKHVFPRPLRLGRNVSAEVEADIGPDTDGLHNIEPKASRPDLDRFDDGLLREKLSFSNCQSARIPVLITLHPGVTAALTQTKGLAYLNAWVDSNRDGDWADSFQCAGANAPAREHILIDFPIDPAKLRAGVQEIVAPTSGPVAWPQDLAGKPAWLRLTLSDQPSNKTLPASCASAACAYGDGRGYETPFRLGETEDYLLLGAGQSGTPDPAVRKRGYIHPVYEQNANQAAWQVFWAVEYYNAGSSPASGVVVRDTLAGPQVRLNDNPFPPLTGSTSGATTEYAVGSLDPGKHGFIGIQARVPFSTPPGTVITNTVEIKSAADGDASNNSEVVTLTIPLLPPLIVDPVAGTTCDPAVVIRGRAQPGASVDLFIDAVLASTLSVGNDGKWSHTATLTAGNHSIYAVARQGGLSSPPSPTIALTVDPSLSWSPNSLRFVDEQGFVTLPRDDEGRADETGWRVRLRPNTTYTVTVRICCTDQNATVAIEVPGVGAVSLTDPDDDGIFTGSFTSGDRASLNDGSFTICATCNKIKRCSDGQVLIDPEGVVYDARLGPTSGLLPGATVACYEQTTVAESATFRLWLADAFGQVNPQVTGGDGYFSFFTPPGTFQLEVTKDGYQPYRSGDIVVTDTPVEYNVPLTPVPAADAAYTVVVGANGFEPAVLTVPPGSSIAWVNVDGSPHTATLQTDGSALAAAAGWDSGLLDTGDRFTVQLSAPGTYTVVDQQNPANSATVVVAANLTIYMPLTRR